MYGFHPYDPGSNPGRGIILYVYIKQRFCSVMVITMDFDSINPGSNPGRTFKLTIAQLVERGTVIVLVTAGYP